MKKGIRVSWPIQSQRRDGVTLTYDEAREQFGLVGTPDELMIGRLRLLSSSTLYDNKTLAVTPGLQDLATRGRETVNMGTPSFSEITLPQLPEKVSGPVSKHYNGSEIRAAWQRATMRIEVDDSLPDDISTVDVLMMELEHPWRGW